MKMKKIAIKFMSDKIMCLTWNYDFLEIEHAGSITDIVKEIVETNQKLIPQEVLEQNEWAIINQFYDKNFFKYPGTIVKDFDGTEDEVFVYMWSFQHKQWSLLTKFKKDYIKIKNFRQEIKEANEIIKYQTRRKETILKKYKNEVETELNEMLTTDNKYLVYKGECLTGIEIERIHFYPSTENFEIEIEGNNFHDFFLYPQESSQIEKQTKYESVQAIINDRPIRFLNDFIRDSGIGKNN
jgi:hypothetical protein